MVGQKLAHYRIEEKLGEGGMGSVWKAVDTQLDRAVAIKVLPPQFADDAERLARFEREARLLASLNHRNIATIYGLAEDEGHRFLVMELVEGEDLGRMLERGPLPVDQAIDVGLQLARALEGAHENGVLHRDLKPANIQITHESRVKVLDFGLAKALESESSAPDPGASPTMTSLGATSAGMILGTAAYMSPEQARGQPLDKRTDIWAFGCVLYECLTGRPAFGGDTMSDTLASVLRSEPDWSRLPPLTPHRVRDLLTRCLQKERRNRQRDAGDARIELQRALSEREAQTSGIAPAQITARPEPRRRRGWTLAAAAVLVVALAAAAGTRWAGLATPTRPSPGRVVRLSMSFPDTLLPGDCLLSPDGARIACAAFPRGDSAGEPELLRLYTRRLDRFELEPVEGSSGLNNYTFSPDGRWLAIRAPVAPRARKQRLSKVPVDGSGPPLPMMEWRDEWVGPLLWHSNGDILARTTGGKDLVRIPSGGGPPRDPLPIRPVGFEGTFNLSATLSAVLPGGRHVLGTVSTFQERGFDISVGALDIETGEARILIENGGSPRWSPTGHLLFARGATVLAVPFDPAALEATGDQLAITDGLRAGAIYSDAWFDLSFDGTLLHRPGGLVGAQRQLYFVDEDLQLGEAWSDERRPFEGNLVVSPDGRRLAVSIVNSEGLYDVWLAEMDRPRLTRWIRETGLDCTPRLWLPDGKRLAYVCQTSTRGSILLADVDGDTKPRTLTAWDTSGEGWAPYDTTAGGTAMILGHWKGREHELYLLQLDDPQASPVPWLADARDPRVSFDGQWLAYIADVTGRFEAYVRPIGEDGRLGPEYPVSKDGVQNVFWRPSTPAGEHRLALLTGMTVREVSFTLRAGEPRFSAPRFAASVAALAPRIQDITPLRDGRLLMIRKGEDEERVTEFSVVLNWFRELEERLAAAR